MRFQRSSTNHLKVHRRPFHRHFDDAEEAREEQTKEKGTRLLKQKWSDREMGRKYGRDTDASLKGLGTTETVYQISRKGEEPAGSGDRIHCQQQYTSSAQL